MNSGKCSFIIFKCDVSLLAQCVSCSKCKWFNEENGNVEDGPGRDEDERRFWFDLKGDAAGKNKK